MFSQCYTKRISTNRCVLGVKPCITYLIVGYKRVGTCTVLFKFICLFWRLFVKGCRRGLFFCCGLPSTFPVKKKILYMIWIPNCTSMLTIVQTSPLDCPLLKFNVYLTETRKRKWIWLAVGCTSNQLCSELLILALWCQTFGKSVYLPIRCLFNYALGWAVIECQLSKLKQKTQRQSPVVKLQSLKFFNTLTMQLTTRASQNSAGCYNNHKPESRSKYSFCHGNQWEHLSSYPGSDRSKQRLILKRCSPICQQKTKWAFILQRFHSRGQSTKTPESSS